jgi:hypothetical protein
MRKAHIFAMLALTAASAAAASIDVSGVWRFALDPQDSVAAAPPDQWRFPDKIRLPGTVASQGFGEEPSFKTEWTGEGWRYPELFKEWQDAANFKIPFFLQPVRRYVGSAWFQREIEIPPDWKGRARLHLERVHWHCFVWIDGRAVGKGDSLGTPHEFDLGILKPGKHRLTLRIDNRIGDVNVGPLSHSVTDHTQGNWNGVVGKMELREVPEARITRLDIFPDAKSGEIRVRVHTEGVAAGTNAQLSLSGRFVGGGQGFGASPSSITGPVTEGVLRLPDPRLWDEFSPNLYQIQATLTTPAGEHSLSGTFGFRDIGHKDGRLAINGIPIFLRGTLECCIFPLTGHPPTDVDSWKRIVRICKAHGLNHIRFHSWCPPEAAFIAADELGFYYQVEVSSWANQGAEVGSGRPLDAWLEAEAGRMLAAYGNHPSFLMMAYGNEPGGKNHAKWLQEWVARRKAEDPRRFHTTGAGWTIMPGSDFHSSSDPRIQDWGEGMKSVINAQPPRTDFDFSDFVARHADAPVVSHEIGQWCVYPNFREMGKYTGHFKARNFEIFRETARRNGLLPQAEDFFMASGKLQTLCYKHDIEAALRTPRFGGFQLLDLHDFPGQGTALVGVLDPFWDSKGYVTPEEYARFSGPVVPLAVLGKMVWTTDETLDARVLLSHFGPSDLKARETVWKLADGETTVAEGSLPARDLPRGFLHELGGIRIPLQKVKAPARLKLTVAAKGGGYSNDWDIFVYQAPTDAAEHAEGVTVTHSLDEALAALRTGGKVLWTPPSSAIADDPSRPLIPGFSSIFWNTAWTKWQPPHTLGILCDPAHPALAAFPTDFHSNWQWWELQKDARPFILTKHHDLRPVVQIIDDWVTHRKLGYVFEAKVGQGRLLACAFDLASEPAKRPVAKQMRVSLLDYMKSGRFSPGFGMKEADLAELVRKEGAAK